MAKAKRWISLLLMAIMVLCCAAGLLTGIAPKITANADAALDSPEDADIDYMRIRAFAKSGLSASSLSKMRSSPP